MDGMWTGLAQSSQNLPAMGMNLLQLRQQRDYNDERIGVQRQNLQETQRLRVTQEQAKQIEAQKLQLAQKEFEEKNPHAKTWNGDSFNKVATAVTMQFGIPASEFPILEHLRAGAHDPNMKKGDIANIFSQTFADKKVETIDTFIKKSEQLAKKATEAENEPERKKIMFEMQKYDKAITMLSQIKNEDATKLFFPDIYQAEANSKASIAAMSQENKTPAHTVTEVTSPDGKSAQKMQYNPKTNRYDIPVGQPYVVKSQVPNINIQTNKKEYDKAAEKIGDAIIAGKQPPVLGGFGMARVAPQVRAYLADKDFDLTTAEQDYNATKKYLGSLNSTQQVRLKQATTFAYDSLDIIEKLGKEWDAGRFAPLNWVNLQAAKTGAYGKDAAKVATKLDAQIADLTSELGTVYKGGNSSTDESLKLAAQNLKSQWDYDVLVENINQIRQNLKIRQNSMRFTGATRMGNYEQPQSTSAQPQVTAPAPDFRKKYGY